MTDDPDRDADGRDMRVRILEAASRLVAEGGIAALTTRAVASAASVQAPTLYRLFGEKRGLLNAVAEHGLAVFVARKAMVAPHPDPVLDLADAWDDYIAFGLANPAVFAIMNEMGVPGSSSPATRAGIEVLRTRVRRIAQTGRLTMPVERAVALIHAAGVGTVATLLAASAGERDPDLASSAREAVMAAILADPPERRDHNGIASLAIALGERLDECEGLTAGERLLLSELMARISTGV